MLAADAKCRVSWEGVVALHIPRLAAFSEGQSRANLPAGLVSFFIAKVSCSNRLKNCLRFALNVTLFHRLYS